MVLLLKMFLNEYLYSKAFLFHNIIKTFRKITLKFWNKIVGWLVFDVDVVIIFCLILNFFKESIDGYPAERKTKT